MRHYFRYAHVLSHNQNQIACNYIHTGKTSGSETPPAGMQYTALNIPWLSFNHSRQIHATIETGISMERLPRRQNNNANVEYYAKEQIGYIQGQRKYLQALRLGRYLLNVQRKFEQSFARYPDTMLPRTALVALNP